MVRKSLKEWFAKQPDRALVGRGEGAQEVVAKLTEDFLREFSAQGNPDAVRLLSEGDAAAVEVVPLVEFEVFWTIENLVASELGPRAYPRVELEREFGSREAVEDAVAVHQRLSRLVQERGARLVPLPEEVEQAEEFMRAVVAERAEFMRRPTRMSLDEIVHHVIRRAGELGLEPAALMAKGQGRRSSEAKAVQQARARVVVELRDRNAALADIGTVLGGRKKESVYALERAGRALQQKEADNG